MLVRATLSFGLIGAVLAAAFIEVVPAEAQLPGRIRSAVTNRVNRAADSAATKAINAALNPGAAGDPAAGSDVTGELKPGEGAWANYDFVPGERALFVEDFASDKIGDFPKRLKLMRGSMEVVDWRGARYLRVLTDSDFEVVLPETMPKRFTVEFDLYLPLGTGYSLEVRMAIPGDDNGPRGGTLREQAGVLYCSAIASGVRGGDVEVITRLNSTVAATVVPCRFSVDDQHVKVYVADRRVANAPQVELGRTDRLHFYVPASEGGEALIGNLRVMAGGLEMYTADAAPPTPPAMAEVLIETGRVATQGIFFDSNSDRIRPESTPTLTEIVEMLRTHADLRLLIEGHTDDVGAEGANLSLSERRAAAVKTYLVAQGGVVADRLLTTGFGESKPAVANDTPEGRQQNRRVELVRR